MERDTRSRTRYADLTPAQRERKRKTDKAWRLKNRAKELERKRKYNKKRRERLAKDRRCEACGGPISERNKSGICSKNYDCRVAMQAKRNAGRATGPKKGESAWLLPIVYDLDTGEEIIDDVAIQVAFEGSRRVGLTTTERKQVILRMIQAEYRYREIADHIGTAPTKLRPILEEMGYVVVPRRTGGSHAAEATEILTKAQWETMKANREKREARPVTTSKVGNRAVARRTGYRTRRGV